MQLNFFIGGYFGGEFKLMLKKENLVCYLSDYPGMALEPIKVFSIKGDTDWEVLIQFLENLEWNKNYDSAICDGIQWSLKFNHNEKKVQSHGSNNYPSEFKELLRLLSIITTKHEIPMKFDKGEWLEVC